MGSCTGPSFVMASLGLAMNPSIRYGSRPSFLSARSSCIVASVILGMARSLGLARLSPGQNKATLELDIWQLQHTGNGSTRYRRPAQVNQTHQWRDSIELMGPSEWSLRGHRAPGLIFLGFAQTCLLYTS